MTIDVFLSMAESQFAGLLLHELNGAACPVWAEKMKKKSEKKQFVTDGSSISSTIFFFRYKQRLA